MGLNKKGIMFSIISLMISMLIITLYSINFDTNFDDEITQVNSRAELIDTNFDVVELNVNSIISLTGRQALENMALATSYLYDNNSHTPYDMNAQCTFNTIMNNGTILLINETPSGSAEKNMIIEVPGTIGLSACSIGLVDIASPRYFTQEFVAENTVYTDIIGLAAASRVAGSEVEIFVYDSCFNLLGHTKNAIVNSSSVPHDCTTHHYTLDKSIQYNKGESYYVTVLFYGGARFIYSGTESHYPNSELLTDRKTETMNELIPGFNPEIDKPVNIYLDDVTAFLNDTYRMQASYEVSEFELSQVNPWEVVIEGNVRVTLNDSFFNIRKVLPFSVIIDIEGMPDPLFHKYGESRIIVRHPPKQLDELNITYLQEMYENESYNKDGNSPKFLDRFSSGFDESPCCGFHSVLKPEDFVGVGHQHNSTGNNSMVDWMFFTGKQFCKDNSSDFFSVIDFDNVFRSAPPSFKLNDETITKYNITNVTATLNDLCS